MVIVHYQQSVCSSSVLIGLLDLAFNHRSLLNRTKQNEKGFHVADCMHALMFFNVAKTKRVSLIHLRPIQDLKGQLLTQNIDSVSCSLISSLHL